MKEFLVSYLTYDVNGIAVVKSVSAYSPEEAQMLAEKYKTPAGHLGKIYER